MLKTIDQKQLLEKKAELEKEFNEKQADFAAKEEQWKGYVQQVQTQLIQLQGAYQAVVTLLESAKK
jgi:hypothetical protein